MTHPKGAQAWIIQLYLQSTPYLPLSRKRQPDGATTDCCRGHLVAAYYSFIDPEKNERLMIELAGWQIYSRRFTDINPLAAAGRAQDRESSPVTDHRSTAV